MPAASTILLMPQHPGESTSRWFERAIVANSRAADDEDRMKESSVDFNQAAQASISQRAADAHDDLVAARRALDADRAKVERPID